MKSGKVVSLFVVVFMLCSVIIFTSCGDDGTTGGTIDEPEISVEYLMGEYKEQLIRDGAEHTFGSITIEDGQDGQKQMVIASKSVVKNDDYKTGYYIADRNISKQSPLDSEARVTYLKDGSQTPEIISAEQLISAAEKDNADGREVLYDVYIIGGQVELVLAKVIK